MPTRNGANGAPNSPFGELLSIGKAAKILGVSINTLRNWEQRGYLLPYRVGPRADRRYELREVLAVLKTGKMGVGR